MHVGQIMHTKLVTVPPNTSLVQAKDIIAEKKIAHLLVVDRAWGEVVVENAVAMEIYLPSLDGAQKTIIVIGEKANHVADFFLLRMGLDLAPLTGEGIPQLPPGRIEGVMNQLDQ